MSLQVKKLRERFCCPAFLEYIRTLGCEDCRVLGLQQLYRTTASHLISVGRADGSDALAVPQCLEHHPQSSASAGELMRVHGINVSELHVRLWNGFLLEKRIYVTVKTQEEFERQCMISGFIQETFSRRKNRT